MLHVLIVGSRGFSDYEKLLEIFDKVVKTDCVEVVSGGADGADTLAERMVHQRRYEFKKFTADWKKYGRSAGPKRNAEMHDYISNFKSRLCIAFWDGKSPGTKTNFDLARRYKNDLLIYNYKDDKFKLLKV